MVKGVVWCFMGIPRVEFLQCFGQVGKTNGAQAFKVEACTFVHEKSLAVHPAALTFSRPSRAAK